MNLRHLIPIALILLPLCSCGPRLHRGVYITDTGGVVRQTAGKSSAQFRLWSGGDTSDMSRCVLPPPDEDTLLPYAIGPGDRFSVLVTGRPESTVPDVVVSPDGQVSLPQVGILNAAGLTMQTLTDSIRTRLRAYYDSPDVSIVMKEYANNSVYVLGRVQTPGQVPFHGQGRLLEALARAGGLSGIDRSSTALPTRCLVMRGKETMRRIDLRAILEKGDMRWNIPLQNGDILFVPQNTDQLVYVLGEVKNPGVVVLGSGTTLLDAVMQAGGPGRDAAGSMYVVRPAGVDTGYVECLDLKNLLRKADFRANVLLEPGDIVYVPRSGFSEFTYGISKVMPLFETAVLGLTFADRSGTSLLLQRAFLGISGE